MDKTPTPVTYAGPQDVNVTAIGASLMITDHGSYAMLGAHHNVSAYDGVAFLDTAAFRQVKVLHDLRVRGANIRHVTVRPRSVSRESDAGVERFFFHDRIFCYAFSGKAAIDMHLDVRDLYDMRVDGRQHEIIERPSRRGVSCYEVRCRDQSFSIFSSVPLRREDRWVEQPTPYDARRGNQAGWWTYLGLSVDVDGDLRVVVSPTRRALEAEMLFAADRLWSVDDSRFTEPIELALPRRNLEGLITRTPSGEPGVLAGLPWFFQIYTRDEAISAGALIALGDHRSAARILLREIGLILPDGRVPNRFPASGTGSADGVGWAFMRFAEILERAPETLRADQWAFVLEQLSLSLSRLRTQDGMVINGPRETWMDTAGRFPDDRRGARIEIQALTIRMFALRSSLERHLGRVVSGSDDEGRLRRRVRESLLDHEQRLLMDGALDGRRDSTVRPNALLCAYIVPDLLSRDEWKAVAEHMLKRLSLPWGGLSSIDTEHLYFQPAHTGQDDDSYHRGDSWYFLNNLIAVGLSRIDDSFRGFAHQVLESSSRDLLCMGAMGHCSEISSALEQEALGCWSQAWSAASLIELYLSLRQ